MGLAGDLCGSQGAQLVPGWSLPRQAVPTPTMQRCQAHEPCTYEEQGRSVSAIPSLLHFYPQHKTGSSFCVRELLRSLQLPTCFFSLED